MVSFSNFRRYHYGMDLMDVLGPLITTSQMFGCLLFRIAHRKRGNYAVRSRSQFVYSVMVCAIEVGLQSALLTYLAQAIFEEESISSVVVTISLTLTYVFLFLTSAYTVFCSAGEIHTVLNQLNRIQRNLLSAQGERLRKLRMIVNILVSITLLRPLLLLLTHVVMCGYSMSHLLIVAVLVYALDAFASQLLCSLISSFAITIGFLYQELLELISKFKVCADAQTLRQLLVADNELKNAGDFINHSYGAFTLLVVLLCFFEIMYGVSHIIVFQDETYSFMWITTFIVQLVSLLTACQFASNQVNIQGKYCWVLISFVAKLKNFLPPFI